VERGHVEPWVRASISADSATSIRPAPAPSPCMKRNATSEAIDPANPHSVDATRKITIPMMNSRFRPNVSESFP